MMHVMVYQTGTLSAVMTKNFHINSAMFQMSCHLTQWRDHLVYKQNTQIQHQQSATHHLITQTGLLAYHSRPDQMDLCLD